MLVVWPGVAPPSSVCREYLIVEDLFPTVLEMAGVDAAAAVTTPVDGVSILPLLQPNDGYPRDRPLYWHFPNNWGPAGPGIGPHSAIRQGDFKLIYYHADRSYELFNLTTDIGEENNLVDAHPDVACRLAGQLARFLKQVAAQMPSDKETGEPVPLPNL
jgi:arylsulfatase A-like enzyme